MYIFKNALKNIGRNRGRNILMSAIIFAIIVTTIVALIINNTSDAVIASYKDRFASEVFITPDQEKIMKEAQKNSTNGRVAVKMPVIPTEVLLALTESEHLKESYLNASVGANNDDIKAIDQSEDSEDDDNSTNDAGAGLVMRMGNDSNYKLYGDYWQDFKDGTRSLAEDGTSRMPENDSECIISSDLADENNIEAGDTLTFTAELNYEIPEDMDLSSYKDGDTITVNGVEYTLAEDEIDGFRASRDVTYELKVVGIYNDLNDEYPNANMPEAASLNRRNEILTTLNTIIAPRSKDERGININATYYLKSPDLLEAFKKEAYEVGLSDQFKVDTDEASYNKIIKPVEGLKGISITFMIVVVVLGAIILLLLCSISIRERKYEIGVLRAMGMKKRKVALGLWAEILIITCVCLVIGIGAGTLAAQPVTNMLLDAQIQAEEDNNSNDGLPRGAMGGGMMVTSAGKVSSLGASSNAKPLSEMDISLGLNTILEIIVIALLLSSVAGLFSISKITKYEPIKILMERN